MKINYTKISTVLLAITFAFSALLLPGCSKKSKEVIEEPEKKFTELNENEQKAILINEFNGRGGDYRLLSVNVFDENGQPLTSEPVEECEKKLIISVPNEIDKNLELKQAALQGACGNNYNGVYHNAIRLTFANYKVGLSFFTVQKGQTGALDYINMMSFDPARNTDRKYLELTSFRSDDYKRMENGEKNVTGRPYKRYTFIKL